VSAKPSTALMNRILLFQKMSPVNALGFVFMTMEGVTPSPGGLLARILLVIPMIQGIPAIRALNHE